MHLRNDRISEGLREVALDACNSGPVDLDNASSSFEPHPKARRRRFSILEPQRAPILSRDLCGNAPAGLGILYHPHSIIDDLSLVEFVLQNTVTSAAVTVDG